MIIKPKRAKKNLRSIDFKISWKAVADELKTRSIDDIRNCWQVKFLPIFDEACLGKGEELWREQDDVELLEIIASQEVED